MYSLMSTNSRTIIDNWVNKDTPLTVFRLVDWLHIPFAWSSCSFFLLPHPYMKDVYSTLYLRQLNSIFFFSGWTSADVRFSDCIRYRLTNSRTIASVVISECLLRIGTSLGRRLKSYQLHQFGKFNSLNIFCHFFRFKIQTGKSKTRLHVIIYSRASQ